MILRSIVVAGALALCARAAAAQSVAPDVARETGPVALAAIPADARLAPPTLAEDPAPAAEPRVVHARADRTGRTFIGAGLGLLAGTAVGMIHGALGHPGLPHTGWDVPDTFEYTPFFALAGAIVGAVIGNGNG